MLINHNLDQMAIYAFG